MTQDDRYINLAILNEERREKKPRNGHTAAAIVLLATMAAIVALIWALCTPAEAEHTDAKAVRYEEDPYVDVVAVDPLQEEKEAIAKTIYGEARGCSLEGKEDVVWTILTRYDDGRFGATIIEVITRPDQFYGYDPENPVWPEHLAIAERIINRWLDGDPGPGWLYFYGDGRENHFRR